MSVLNMSDEEKKEIHEKHNAAIKKDREDRDAMNGVSKEKKEEKKKE